MIRIILLLILAAVVAVLLWRAGGSTRIPGRAPRPISRMVQCSRCGVFVPEDEALSTAEQQYLCRSHDGKDPEGE